MLLGFFLLLPVLFLQILLHGFAVLPELIELVIPELVETLEFLVPGGLQVGLLLLVPVVHVIEVFAMQGLFLFLVFEAALLSLIVLSVLYMLYLLVQDALEEV